MRKLNPEDIADNFEKEVTALLDYYTRSVSALRGSSTEKSDVSMLTEHIFLATAISFEGALSDLYFAYTNIDSSRFIAAREAIIKESIKKDFGDWYADKFNLGAIKHIKVDELYPLLDPRGFNITFHDAKQMVDKAKKQLDQAYAAKYTALSSSELKLINAVRFVRNCIAHRSNASYKAMSESLQSLQNSVYRNLSRSKDKQVNSIGAYLKSWAGTASRLEIYLAVMRDIVIKVGR